MCFLFLFCVYFHFYIFVYFKKEANTSVCLSVRAGPVLPVTVEHNPPLPAFFFSFTPNPSPLVGARDG
jgi:hypothetical protein